MEIFISLKRQLKFLAYFHPTVDDTTSYLYFYSQNISIFVHFMFLFFLPSYYFLFEAKTFNEYAESFYFASTSVLVWGSFMHLATVRTQMTKHLFDIEKIVKRRE